MNILTAEQLFSNLQQLPTNERQQFFVLLSDFFDGKEDFTHKEVFRHLDNAMFTASEAAEYLEVSIATFRRYLKAKKIVASEEIGTTHLYSLDALRVFKKALRMTKKE